MVHKSYDVLPENLVRSSLNLNVIGLNELAWDHKNAIHVINLLLKSKIAILGGDVYKLDNEIIVPTYDNWYISNKRDYTWSEFVHNSVQVSIKFVNEYHRVHGSDYFYSIVFVNEEQYLAL